MPEEDIIKLHELKEIQINWKNQVDKIREKFEYYTPITKNKADIVLAKLGNDAGIYGAAKLVLG